MNRNHLKIIACISMVIDHIGYVLFPDIQILRLIGRVAMPIFAFFIGEGCFYTKNRKKYFSRIFLLGLICQSVYIAESLITKSGGGLYLNILLTFSCSVIICGSFLDFKNDHTASNRNKFILSLVGFFALNLLCNFIKKKIGVNLTFDYGFAGMVLPLFAVIFNSEKSKKLTFLLGTLLFSYCTYGISLHLIFALISPLLIYFYNGQPGKKKLNTFFYLFYPLHLAIIYGFGIIM